MRRWSVLALLVLGCSQFLLAGGPPPGTPEIDPATGVSAIVLLSGALLILKTRRRA
jgi:hypothetical protein